MITCAVPEGQLLLHFQEFYRELHRLREQAALAAMGASMPVPGSETLVHLLEQQAATARTTLDARSFEIYREAQYVMAALADELLARSEGSLQPPAPGLEQRFFRANSAADVFFQKLEILLQGQDPEHFELARIYFFAICLGFQGKYRHARDLAPLAEYRQQLFSRIFGGQPTLPREDAPLTPLAPVQTVPEDEIRSLPHPQIWLALPAGVLLLWVLFSFVFWTGFVRPITRIMDAPAHSNAVSGR